MDLDHVAVGTRDHARALATLTGDLGALVMEGGDGYGFRWVQARVGDADAGMTVEVITPWEPQVNDFLERFVAAQGERQHHLTFKVQDLAATLERVRQAGYRPVGVSFDDPGWREAFLVPREAQGTVVQLAQVADDFPPLAERYATVMATGAPDGRPRWWADPPARAEVRATLRRVVMQTTSITAALGFWAGLLGGDEETSRDGQCDLVWPGGGRVRLVESPDATPGFSHLEAEAAVPEPREVTVGGARVLVLPAA